MLNKKKTKQKTTKTKNKNKTKNKQKTKNAKAKKANASNCPSPNSYLSKADDDAVERPSAFRRLDRLRGTQSFISHDST